MQMLSMVAADAQKAGAVKAVLLCLEHGGREALMPSCRAQTALLSLPAAREDFARAQGTSTALRLLQGEGQYLLLVHTLGLAQT